MRHTPDFREVGAATLRLSRREAVCVGQPEKIHTNWSDMRAKANHLIMTTVLPPLSPDAVNSGKPIHPLKRISLLDDKEFEELIEEWANQQAYVSVEHLGGAGDEGRDVCGFLTENGFLGEWDAFQCKRREKPLMPTDVWHDIGKLIWNVQTGKFLCPRIYHFICSKGIGTKLTNLLNNVDKLRSELLNNWEKYVETTIMKEPVPLTTELRNFIKGFDFSIFGKVQLQSVVKDIEGTSYYVETFGGGLPQRPSVPDAPKDIQPSEAVYLEKLRQVYSEHAGTEFADCPAIQNVVPYSRHLDQQRTAFFCAESLREFSIESVPEGTFDALQTGILDGIQPVLDDDRHEKGYTRLNESLKQAAQISPTDNPLHSVATVRDKKGICHQLANEKKLDWIPHD